MPKAYGYLRVSHRDQSDNTFGTQRSAIDERFNRIKAERPDMEWGEAIADKAVSAYRKGFFQRPGAARLNGLLKKGDVVIFSRVDRAFRNLMDMWKTVEHWKSRGVEFIFCDLPLQPGTPFGDMFLSNMGAYAQLDSALKSERVKAGLRTKKEQGYTHGICPKGFQRVWSTTQKMDILVEDLEARRMYEFMIPLREKGMGFYRISDEVEDWLAKRENRKSRRGLRSKYRFSTRNCELIFRRFSQSDKQDGGSASQSDQ